MNEPYPGAHTDCRRATVLWTHRLTDDVYGFAQILAEADEDPRDDATLMLLTSVMDLAQIVSPALNHPDIIGLLQQTAAEFALEEETKPC